MIPAVCATLLALLCAISSPAAHARLTISGPQDPVLEGDDVTLECLSDDDSDMGNYTFERYTTWMKTWFRLDASRYLRCWYFSVNISRSSERLLMHLSDVSEWQTGPYRCVNTDNRTGEEASEPLTINVVYLQNIYLQRVNSWYGYVPDIMWVEEGSTVEVKCTASASQEPMYEWSQEASDWILPSDTLILKNVQEESEGRYVCQARHPDMSSLVKTRSFELRVTKKSVEQVRDAVYGLNFGDILLYIAIPGVMLTVLLFTLLTILIRYRRRQMKKPQISLVDDEKRAPIYKGSLQSVASSTASDTQPLVM
ncbi:basal cell adhesion molecule-like [Anomaloglossus baeobatrachus]|uniref:basal cell adhesion molecule-like n=1 Tax=Anomaloglossus baeobatrachus TaxID=238106 RepID=UPI003F4FA257